MKELKQCCLHHVSGGATSVSSGCPDCDDFFGIEDEELPVTNWNNWGGRYSGAISVIGSRFGFVGSVSGFVVGSIIDVVDFNALGGNYKNNIMNEIKQGNIPLD